MNKIMLVGRLSRDVELAYTQKEQKPVAKFGLAVDNGYGDNKSTDFFNVTVFGKQAENADKYLAKGRQIALCGRVHINQYEKDGQKRSYTEVIAEQIDYIGGNNNSESKNAPKSEAPKNEAPMRQPDGFLQMEDEDIPF